MRFVLILLAGLLAGGASLAQPKWDRSQIYTGNIDIGGVQIPLPAGDWAVTSFQTFATKSNAAGGTGGDVKVVALVQAVGKVIRSYMMLSYNERAMSSGWTAPDETQCARQDVHHARIVRDKQLSKSCEYVSHVINTTTSASAQWWKDHLAYAQQNKLTFPSVSILSGIIVSDHANFISVSYVFNPVVFGFPKPAEVAWQNSDWNVTNVAGDAKKKAFVQSIVDWTERSRPVVEAGLAGKLKKGEGLDLLVFTQP